MQTENRTEGARSATRLRLVASETKTATLYYTDFHGDYMKECAGILPGSRLLMTYATEDRPPRDGEVVWFDWGRFGYGCGCVDLGVVKWESADSFAFTHDSYGHPSSVNDTGGKWDYRGGGDPRRKEYVMRVVAVEFEGVTRWTTGKDRERYAGVEPRRLPSRDERANSIQVENVLARVKDYSDKTRGRMRRSVEALARRLDLRGLAPKELYVEALGRGASVKRVDRALAAAQEELDAYAPPPVVKKAPRGAFTLKAEDDDEARFGVRSGDVLVLDAFGLPKHGELVALWNRGRRRWEGVGRYEILFGDERSDDAREAFGMEWATGGGAWCYRDEYMPCRVASIARAGAKRPARKASEAVERMEWPAEIPG
jgi:SOS-response transcriptional repressor LexA